MYYYIIETPSPNNLVKLQTKLKQIMGELDIRGEIAVASPARQAEELARMALEKGYTTLVAVGNDGLVNRLASLLAGNPAALGIIPLDISTKLSKIFGVGSINEACRALKRRNIRSLNLAHITPNKYFLSDAIISSSDPVKFTLQVDGQYELQVGLQEMTVTSDLDISFSTPAVVPRRRWGLFVNPTPNNEYTSIHARALRISTPKPLCVSVEGNIIAKTPVEITKALGVLKIITGYDTIE